MVADVVPFQITHYGLTDTGLVRPANEDVFRIVEDASFFVVADGMGGHQAGEVAAGHAVDHLCSMMRAILDEAGGEHNPADMATMIRLAIIEVNRRVHKLGQRSPHLKGMGTTLAAIYFHGQFAICSHVGDSRIYRLRGSTLQQLTKDHSLYRELVDLGHLSNEASKEFSYKNVITKAIGTAPAVEPSVGLEELHGEDIFLICSDGLTDLVSDKEISSILLEETDVEQQACRLVQRAKERGGYDNITVVIAKVEERDEQKDLPG